MHSSELFLRHVRVVVASAILTFLVACGGGTAPGSDAGDAGTGSDMRVGDGSLGDGGGDAATTCGAAADCDDHLFCTGIERCAPGTAGADARGCVAATDPVCAATQTCDETGMRCMTTSCAGSAADADGDGHHAIDCGGDDCNDADANRYPGNVEVCDAASHDEDCDDNTYGFRDLDGDGSVDAACCNTSTGGSTRCGADCNDMSTSVHPGATESCNGVDDDCNAMVDEGVLNTFYVDADGDGFGAVGGATMTSCFMPTGYASSNTDCDDTRAAVHPGAVEICDAPDGGASLDEDCDGVANPSATCMCTVGATQPCMQPGRCAAGMQACSGGTWGACSIMPTTEVCNGEDDDCNGTVDDLLRVTCYVDGDNDGYAASAAAMSTQCPQAGRESVGGCPSGYTNRTPFGTDIDCNDASSPVHPGATEVCVTGTAGVDDNCNGLVDEGVAQPCYTDGDNDGYALSGTTPVSRCIDGSRPDGCPFGNTARVPSSMATIDCNDTSMISHPGGTETCDGTLDENCNGAVDEGCACVSGMTRACTQPGVCATGIQNCAAGTWGACSVLPMPETCNMLDDNCNGATDEGVSQLCYADADGDGYAATGAVGSVRCIDGTRPDGCPVGYTARAPSGTGNVDCDDAHTSAHPGGMEVCEGSVDENCSGMVDEGCTCTNGTTRMCPQPGVCAGGIQNCASGTWSACSIAPTTEICNSLDDNCNGSVDETVAQPCYPDNDNDGYALSGASATSQCIVGARPDGCPVNWTARMPTGSANIDCDDVHVTAHPGGTEVCEGSVDENCSGTVDEGCSCTNGTSRGCPQPGICAGGTQMCTGGMWSTCSILPGTETCNGLDDNCNGATDEGVTTNCYIDADLDGYAAMGAAFTTVCGGCASGRTSRAPVGAANIDCDDGRMQVHPGAMEQCDGRDDDCSSGTSPTALPAEDADGDMHAAPTAPCTGGYAKDDCQDFEMNVHPGQTAYFSTPYCPNGSGCYTECAPACLVSGGLCSPGFCSGTTVAATFDYDCSGASNKQPSGTNSCNNMGSCIAFPGCDTSHPYYVGGGPACGVNVPYWTCGCSGMGCLGGSSAMRGMPCH